MKIISILLWVGVFIGAGTGALITLFSFTAQANAIQQTSLFAFALMLVILPYCVARAFDEIFRDSKK
jgi:hypothetical protein